MLFSMTGYGKSKVRLGDKSYAVEIKCLNSKQLDLNFKLVSELREKELDIRKAIAAKLVRGKVDLYFAEDKSTASNTGLNLNLIETYYQQLDKFCREKNIPMGTDALSAILRFQDVSKTELAELNDNDVAALHKAVESALEQVVDFRRTEGSELEKDLAARILAIRKLKSELEPFENKRIERIREKLSQDLNTFIQEEAIDKNRFEEELIYYLEKIDINEEKVRLDTHCKYFTEVLAEAGMEKGKKLGFIAQEIGREINTIGSKANDADMQRIVILMKEELEKIKEQALNIL